MPLKLIPPRSGKTPNYAIRGTYLKVYVDRSCGTHEKSKAGAILRRLKERIERGEYPVRAPAPVGKTFIQAAVAYMKAGGERENMARLIEYFGETPIDAIDQDAVDAAALDILPSATPATRNRKVYTPVSAVLRRAGREIRLARPPGAKGRVVTEFLTPQDAFAIIGAADDADRPFGVLLRVLLYTGCRISEAMAMRWEDMDLTNRWAYIGKTKNGDPRTTLLRQDVVEALQWLKGEQTEGRVFPFRKGGGLKDRLLRAKLTVCGVPTPKRQRDKTGRELKANRRIPPHRLKFVGFHTFRHTFATWFRRFGGGDVQGLVGTGNWRDPRSAARYAHVAAHEEWARVEKMPIVTRGKSVD